MAEKQVDGGQTDGTSQVANEGASSQSGVQQPSFDATKLQESLDALNSGFKALESRVNGLQSVKDKDQQAISGLKKKIADYEQLKERLGPEGAMEQIELRDQLAQMNQALEKLTGSVSTPTPGKGQGVAESLAQVILDYKLDANDPGVAKILADHKGNDLKAASELGRHAASIASRQTGDPSASTSINATAPVETTDAKTLWKEYQKDVAPLRGNVLAVTNLQKEYRKRAQEAGVTLNI